MTSPLASATLASVLARVFSRTVIGLEGVIAEAEVDTAQGLPGIDIAGLPDKAVQESRSRVQAAVKKADLRYPRQRVVVKLAPASVRKEGPSPYGSGSSGIRLDA